MKRLYCVRVEHNCTSFPGDPTTRLTAPYSNFELLVIQILDVVAEDLVQDIGHHRFEHHLVLEAAPPLVSIDFSSFPRLQGNCVR